MNPIVFKKPKDVKINETEMGDVTVSIHDTDGKYHYFIIEAEAAAHVANPPEQIRVK